MAHEGFAKPIGKYCAILAISRHEKNRNEAEIKTHATTVWLAVCCKIQQCVFAFNNAYLFNFDLEHSRSRMHIYSTSTMNIHIQHKYLFNFNYEHSHSTQIFIQLQPQRKYIFNFKFFDIIQKTT